MPQQRATSANNGLPQRFGTSPRLVFDTFRFVTSIAEQSRAKSFGHAERRQAFIFFFHDSCFEIVCEKFNFVIIEEANYNSSIIQTINELN
jgi:hypothetical protein